VFARYRELVRVQGIQEDHFYIVLAQPEVRGNIAIRAQLIELRTRPCAAGRAPVRAFSLCNRPPGEGGVRVGSSPLDSDAGAHSDHRQNSIEVSLTPPAREPYTPPAT
jgi:hypothetical protein